MASFSLPCPPASGSDLLQPILVMQTTENRLGPHSISRGNLMSLLLQRHRQAVSRLWKPWSQARMGPCLTVMGPTDLAGASSSTFVATFSALSAAARVFIGY